MCIYIYRERERDRYIVNGIILAETALYVYCYYYY